MAKDFADINRLEAEAGLHMVGASKNKAALSGLMKAWEAKNAKRALQGAGLTTMAVTLAACGGSDDTTDAGAGTDAGTDTDTPTTTPVALSALQSAVADIVKSNVTGLDGVEAATLTLATNSTALSLTATSTAPTTADATELMIGEAAARIITVIDGTLGGNALSTILNDLADGTLALNPGTDADDQADFDFLVDAFSATTAADRLALSDALETVDGLLLGATTQASLALTNAVNAAAAGATPNATEASDIAALRGVTSAIATNALNTLRADTTAATPAELAAGLEAYANLLVTAVASATGTTLTGVQKTAAIADLIDVGGGALAADQAGDGVNGGATGNGAVLVVAVAGEIDTAAAAAAIETDLTLAAASIDTALGGGVVTATALADLITGGATPVMVPAVAEAQLDAALINGVVDLYEEMLEMVTVVGDAQVALDALDVQATIIELQNDGTSVILATGATVALSDNDDMVGYITDLDNSVTIGSAAESFGATGTDTLIISGEYKFVTITKAQYDTRATEAFEDSDATALEIFVYQEATSGDTVMLVERTAGEGNVEGDTMSTIRLVDTTFADLTPVVAEGVTILSSEAAVVA